MRKLVKKVTNLMSYCREKISTIFPTDIKNYGFASP